MIYDTWLPLRDYSAQDIEHKGAARAQDNPCCESGERDHKAGRGLLTKGARRLAPSLPSADFMIKPVAFTAPKDSNDTQEAAMQTFPRAYGDSNSTNHSESNTNNTQSSINTTNNTLEQES